MSDHTLFGELRSLLQMPPTVSRWIELCQLLDAFEAKTLSGRVMPYVNGSMSAWPDAYRVAPRRWIERIREGEEIPQLACAREIIWRGITNALVGEEDFAGLIDLPGSPTLEASDIMVTVDPLGFDGVVAIERSGCLEHISRLSLPRNQLERGELRVLAGALAVAPELKTLELAGCGLGPRDIEALVRRPGFEKLEVLDLEDNRIDSLGLRHLLSRPWPSLKKLMLGNNRISSSGLEGLEDGVLPGVEHLNLMGNPIGDDGVRWMCDTGGFSKLRYLDLTDCSLFDGAARALAQATHLENLERLKLGLNVISQDAYELVLDQFPRLLR